MGKGKKGVGRGSGKRFSAQSAEEIESRNARLEEFNAERARRRADAEEDGDDDKDAAAEREAMEIGMRLKNMSMNGKGGDDVEFDEKERKKKGVEGIISVENPNWTKALQIQKAVCL